MVAILCQCASNETMAIRGRGTRHHGAAMVMKELLAARQKGKIETVSACIQTRSLFCSGLRCCALLEGLHDLINFSGAGGSVEYTHNGVSIGWHIAKKPGLKTFVVQRAELQRANDKNILQTR